MTSYESDCHCCDLSLTPSSTNLIPMSSASSRHRRNYVGWEFECSSTNTVIHQGYGQRRGLPESGPVSESNRISDVEVDVVSQSQSQEEQGHLELDDNSKEVTKSWRTSSSRSRPLRLSPLTRTMSSLVSLIILSTVFLCSMCYSSKVYNVSWNSSNPIFRIDNTDHIIDVNRDNLPYDQVNIICPVYAPGTKEEDAEKYIIYNVSKEEYDSCRITNPNPRIIAVCDKPYKLLYFTITFRSFTPTPGGLEFRPGQDYYFISTSSRDDLHRRVGGRCSSENMKVVFKVCCHPGESTAQLTTTPAPPAAPLIPRFTTLSTVLPTTKIARRPQIVYTSSSTTSATTYLPPIISTRYPLTKTQNKNNPNFKTTSKTKTLDKHPNEVVKNEELTSASSIPAVSTLFIFLLLAVTGPLWWLR